MPTEHASPPDAWKTPSRTEATEMQYLRRALWFESHAAGLLSIVDPDPREVAACAIHRKPEWAASTWRQTKAALVFRYSAMNTASALDAVRLLKDEGQLGCAKNSKKTSALRSKSVSEADLQLLLSRIRMTNSSYAAILDPWMLLGSTFGLRPHEWCFSTLMKVRPSEVEGVDLEDDEPRWYMRVRNAKSSNGRSHGIYRHLDVSDCPQALITAAAEFAALMASVNDNGLYERYYRGCQRLLSRVNATLHRRGTRVIQLYSVRHRFASMVKNRFNLAEIGALMGHATDKTASGHYGRRVSGHSAAGVRPAAIEVARVLIKKTPLPNGLFGLESSTNSPNSDNHRAARSAVKHTSQPDS